MDTLELNKPVLNTKLFRSSVPEVNVAVRVEPLVKFPASWYVAVPLKMNGKSTVTPLVVITCVPEVAAKEVLLPPAVIVTVAGIVKLPYSVLELLPNVPENPVRLSVFPLLNARISVPAVTLKLRALASVSPVVPPKLLVRVPVAPEYVKLTVGVPV